MDFVIGIDQSTQGTKLLLFDEEGKIRERISYSHRQLVNSRGWISHDMEEIFNNILCGVESLWKTIKEMNGKIKAVGISNQRETTVAWDAYGTALAPAIVWQCKRASGIVQRLVPDRNTEEMIQKSTGLLPSSFFPAAKMAWLMENADGVRNCKTGLHLGTVDSYLLYRLTKGEVFATDYSNASRTQLFNIHTLQWDAVICSVFHIPMECLPEVRDSNDLYGYTDFNGILSEKVPIHSILGDSHAALYGQGCHNAGMAKVTYGTGSSMMLHTGTEAVQSRNGLVTSLAWGMDGEVSYVLEGNINYSGAVISWLANDLRLIASTEELEGLIAAAKREDTVVLVPAFTGLSAPYWRDDIKAAIVGMTRTTGKAEVVKAAVESIAYQVADVYCSMYADYNGKCMEIRADGGPTANQYLMQFQSDMLDVPVSVSRQAEFSAIGTAYMAGIAAGVYRWEDIYKNVSYQIYKPEMPVELREKKRHMWQKAVQMILHKET